MPGSTGTQSTKAGTVSYYLWDGLNLLEERDSSGNLIARYSYGYSSIYGIGSCVEIYQQASEHKYTLVMDHRGTAYVLLDETGTEIGRRWYDAFGVLLGSTGSWPVDLGYQSNGLSFNLGGMDLCLSKYRIYVPALGIFVSRDFLPFINKYGGFNNNPVNMVDPAGLDWEWTWRGTIAHTLISLEYGAEHVLNWKNVFLNRTIGTIVREGWGVQGCENNNDQPDIANVHGLVKCLTEIYEIKSSANLAAATAKLERYLGAEKSAKVKGLDNTVDYSYRVTAVNAGGISPSTTVLVSAPK